jgi:hypothetical protein
VPPGALLHHPTSCDAGNLIPALIRVDEEARYINGQTYIADGGMLAHNPSMADLIDLMAPHVMGG